MLFPVIVLAANAAKESLKVCKLKYFGLGMYRSTAVFALHLYLHVLYFYMEVFLLFLKLLDGFFSSKELVFLSAINFG